MKLSALRDYLISMRREDYALVGIEQTAQSQCITKYRFHHKTVLVLGYVNSSLKKRKLGVPRFLKYSPCKLFRSGQLLPLPHASSASPVRGSKINMSMSMTKCECGCPILNTVIFSRGQVLRLLMYSLETAQYASIAFEGGAEYEHNRVQN